MSEAEHLRIFFFSDWRIQPLELAEELIRSVAPVDLIVYGGDDVSRFVPMPDIPHVLTIGERQLQRLILPEDDVVVLALRQQFGQEPLDILQNGPIPISEVYARFRNPVKDNWLSKISSHARYGVLAIVGNDCQPYHRAFLTAPGVRDIHASPVVIGGWGFVGIEGALYQGKKNSIGYVLHADGEAKQHLMRAVKTLGIDPKRLVIVSHTPPAGCRLDYAIRFGFDRLGSKTLQNFVLKRHPALVLSGHCHSRGGKHAYLGTTLVVNGASDDTRIQGTRACLIELSPNKPPQIEWLDPMPFSIMSVPEIGIRRAEILRSYGITTPQQLFAAPGEVLSAIQFGTLRTARLRAHERALLQQMAVWLETPVLPEKMLFYDVETGLNIGDPLGFDTVQEPWMIAISDGGEVTQWVVPEEDREARKKMYQGFLKYVRSHPDYTLCSYSGYSFDDKAIEAGLLRWHSRGVREWRVRDKLDLLRLLKKRLALPTRSWTLKEVAAWCGYSFATSDLDGFEVGLFYEAYRQFGDDLPVEAIARYNMEDVRALAFLAQWVREQNHAV